MITEQQEILRSLLLLALLIIFFVLRVKSHRLPYLKYTSYWLGVFLVIGIIYSFSDFFIDAKNKFLTNLIPGYSEHKGNQLIVRKADDGHFYLIVKFNEESVRMMIDTGASTIVLPSTYIDKLAIDKSKLSFSIISQTANGISENAPYVIEKMMVNDFAFYNVPLLISKSGLDTPLLGMSFLQKLQSYEFLNDKLILRFKN